MQDNYQKGSSDSFHLMETYIRRKFFICRFLSRQGYLCTFGAYSRTSSCRQGWTLTH